MRALSDGRTREVSAAIPPDHPAFTTFREKVKCYYRVFDNDDGLRQTVIVPSCRRPPVETGMAFHLEKP